MLRLTTKSSLTLQVVSLASEKIVDIVSKLSFSSF